MASHRSSRLASVSILLALTGTACVGTTMPGSDASGSTDTRRDAREAGADSDNDAAVQETGTDATVSETATEAGPDATSDAFDGGSSEPAVEPGPEPSVAEPGPEAGTPEPGPEAGTAEPGPEAGTPEPGPEPTVLEAGAEASADATAEAGPDAGPDATPEAGPDAVADAGADATPEASVEAGPDASVTPSLFVLFGGASNVWGGRYTQAGGWSVSTLNDSIAGATQGGDIAALGNDRAVAVIRHAQSGNAADGQLRYATYDGTAWSSFAQIASNSTRGTPSLASGSPVQLVFHGTNYHHYYAAFDGTTWNPTAQDAVLYGPSAGSLTALGTDAVLFFVNDGSNDLRALTRTGAAWASSASTVGGGTNQYATTPAIVALASGPELLAVWAANNGQLQWATRSSGTWSSAQNLASALTNHHPALAALPNGSAVLAYRGQNGQLYNAFFATGSWSTPSTFVSTNFTSPTYPAVSRGVGDAIAEVVFVGDNGMPYHSRFIGTAWTNATQIAAQNGLVQIALTASR